MVCLAELSMSFLRFQLLLSYAGFRTGARRNPSVQSSNTPMNMDFSQEKPNQFSIQFGIISEEDGRWVQRGLEA